MDNMVSQNLQNLDLPHCARLAPSELSATRPPNLLRLQPSHLTPIALSSMPYLFPSGHSPLFIMTLFTCSSCLTLPSECKFGKSGDHDHLLWGFCLPGVCSTNNNYVGGTFLLEQFRNISDWLDDHTRLKQLQGRGGTWNLVPLYAPSSQLSTRHRGAHCILTELVH